MIEANEGADRAVPQLWTWIWTRRYLFGCVDAVAHIPDCPNIASCTCHDVRDLAWFELQKRLIEQDMIALCRMLDDRIELSSLKLGRQRMFERARQSDRLPIGECSKLASKHAYSLI